MNDKNEFLGKKKLNIQQLTKSNIKNIINTNDNKSDSDLESDEDLKNYKSFTSGKINIKNILSDRNNISDEKLKNLNVKSIQNNTNKNVSNYNNSLSNKLLNLLPPPKKNFIDKNFIQPKQEFLNLSGKYKSLANPDTIEHDENIESTQNQIINNKSNMIEINVNDQIDSNWEIKYIGNLNKEENNKNKDEEPSDEQKNKNHLLSLIHDYKKQQK